MFFILALLFGQLFATKVNVMLPLRTVSNDGNLDESVAQRFPILKNAGVNGVMVDVWWGIVEKTPKTYNFKPYLRLAQLCQQNGLKLQCVMSFHQCGGNVGDDCNIPIPSWAKNNANVFYRDAHGHDDTEVISLDVDEETVLQGRTPRQVYKDFMEAFALGMGSFMGSVIEEIQVGLGPCGELRYPGYQLDRWSFPGVGEFQAFSPRMKELFANASKQAGHPEWTSPPTDAGSYNSRPDETSFFTNGYRSAYGNHFMNWYTQLLIDHGRRILTDAVSIFKPLGVGVAMKVSGIHWWYNHASHAAELTTGYINGGFSTQDFYSRIASLCAELGVVVDFTCFEMSNNEQSQDAKCAPENLVYQVLMACKNANVAMSAENALARYDATAYNRIITNACNRGGKVAAFTYLRLTDNLVYNGQNLNEFKRLISTIRNC